jgi:hypothetical protein
MKYVLIAAFLLAARSTKAQRIKIDSLAFMQGRWTQQHAWGDMEEFWGAPMGNSMMCSYRCVNKGKAVFYEFILVEQTDSVPVMRLRHFGPGNIAWEDKKEAVEMPLTALQPNKVTFETKDQLTKLIYTVVPGKTMHIDLEETNKKGEHEKFTFDYVYH